MHEVSYLLGGWGCLAGLAGGAMGRRLGAEAGSLGGWHGPRTLRLRV